eukprot:766803-Hanusia_phi.AAC.6
MGWSVLCCAVLSYLVLSNPVLYHSSSPSLPCLLSSLLHFFPGILPSRLLSSVLRLLAPAGEPSDGNRVRFHRPPPPQVLRLSGAHAEEVKSSLCPRPRCSISLVSSSTSPPSVSLSSVSSWFLQSLSTSPLRSPIPALRPPPDSTTVTSEQQRCSLLLQPAGVAVADGSPSLTLLPSDIFLLTSPSTALSFPSTMGGTNPM